jgi:hypothetical protein
MSARREKGGRKGDVQCEESQANSTTPVRTQNDHRALWLLDSIEDSTAVRFRHDIIRPRGQETNRLGDVERGLATKSREGDSIIYF